MNGRPYGQKGLLLKRLEHGDVVNLRQLAEMLWPDADKAPLAAENHITTLVCQLRKRGFKIRRVTGYVLE